MTPIRWGIIGCGDVTEVKSGPGFQQARHSELVAVMRRNGRLAREYAERHGVPRWYDDAQALIDDPGVDAVYVATPPSSHKQYTLLAAQAGKPVYVEKPMALNYAECLEMIDACRSAGVPLFVAYYRRALERFRNIKELLDAGAIGSVRTVAIMLRQPPAARSGDQLPWRVQPEISGGGHFVDLAAHMLDLLDFFFGPIGSVAGFASNQAGLYAAEDIVTASWMFDNGLHGVGTWCFTAGDHVDQTEIVGERGTIRYATFSAQPVVLTTVSGVQTFAFDDPAHIQQPLIQTVVDTLLDAGVCPSTGDSGARTSRVMDQMLAAFRSQHA